jgi:hypothetical protein
MRSALDAIGALIGGLLGLVMTFVVLSTSLGVVREDCLDVPATQAAQRIAVDKHWTYILWPPFTLASSDPPGRCVRNSPVRQGLDAVGIWKLPTPEEQVREHVVAQLKARGQPSQSMSKRLIDDVGGQERKAP